MVDAQSSDIGVCSHKNSSVSIMANLSQGGKTPLELEEDEDEDVDFNPFLKETLSPEASSSLSSEIEGVEMDTIDSRVKSLAANGTNLSLKHTNNKSDMISPSVILTVRETDNGSSSGVYVVNDAIVMGDLSDTAPPNNHTLAVVEDDNDNDAICRRTRARYSLANFSLDELETFLQETDDEDDLQNVDDEEEYRKFLAAVLQGGDGESPKTQENENVDDEDEDNDADFEVEIEEALESDPDETFSSKSKKEKYETRQRRRRKASLQNKEKCLELAKRPLRPLLPIMPNVPIATIAPCSFLESASQYHSSVGQECIGNGFTPHQIGQLYCLIHEHLQLLIQVFSLCVFEPSKQHIASQVQELISEIIRKREQAVSGKSVPFPSFCFSPPYISSSVPDESESYQNMEGFVWVPFISGSVLSIMDVAPLHLVGKYMDDVSIAVREYQRRHVESSCDSRFEREPLFSFPSFPSCSEATVQSHTIGEVHNSACNLVVSSSPSAAKKTFAATLVENTKKQSVALVPREIVKLAQRFVPLFNPSLFPHKPPPVAVANRVLFTDAEDELLAMGLMKYNTDWKTIQQVFLPCKSKHQIFVRQKNRCSSKAPDNPIKAVRRLKTSPLTAEEKTRIQEGLRVYKLDWMSIWKFIVPHRDPTLLMRQFRIATGTQKSYKTDAAKKEKRRIYESNRRKFRGLSSMTWQSASEKEENETENGGEVNGGGDDLVENDNEAYVHEAFMADWRPETSNIVASGTPSSNIKEGNPSGHILPQVGSFVKQQPNRSLLCSWPYRSRRKNRAQLVKLAPDLPPVNLPPSVRVISKSAFGAFQSGTSVKFLNKSAQKSNPMLKHNMDKDSVLLKDKCILEEKGTESFQMHPLLFQATEGRRLPFCPSNSNAAMSGYFSFLPKYQPQLNLSLFPTSYSKSNTPVTHSLKPLESIEASTSSLVEFHPLLQRTGGLKSALSPNMKPCELDLEIHLSSTSRKGQSGSPVEVKGTNGLNYQSSVSNGTDKFALNDQSLPEIVMEQEELSDSDEEIGEDVEFEQEEMADSEGEGSDCEQIANIQEKKEVRNEAMDIDQTRNGDRRTNNPLLLSLDSASLYPPYPKPKCTEGPARRSKAPTRSKKGSLSRKTITAHKRAIDTATNQGINCATQLKRPRKRTCRNNSSTGMGLEGSSHFSG